LYASRAVKDRLRIVGLLSKLHASEIDKRGCHVWPTRAQTSGDKRAPMTCLTSPLIALDLVIRRSHSAALAGSSLAWRGEKGVDKLARLDEQMALLADGDRSAIEPLFAALWPLVHSYCQRTLGHGADADDAAQQALLKVFTESVRYERRLHALPWAVEIAVWECRTVRRRRHRTQAVPLDAAVDARTSEASTEDAVIEHDLIEGVWTIFGQLSPSDRDALRKMFDPDTDAIRGVSGAALRKRRERALGRLREAWRKRYGG
jgi:RNA polymerase sigma-70 factor, ECF subfamily